jgi:hypothetical protein
MRKLEKSISDITISDIKKYPVWEYISDEANYPDESWIKPVKKYPVETLENRIIGLQVTIANGQKLWAIIENIDFSNDEITKHCISLDLFYNDDWIPLARYYDINYNKYGPQQLADTIGLPIDEVFPIRYELPTSVCKVNHYNNGIIKKTPDVILSNDMIIDMIIKNQRK